mmetsp:Transcript_10894/g.26642  ORF Transcript_10894/g.26642 Transcript_10894/m.26642 type:complete len:206 (-) Transcript_10894:184-801(-)
MRSSSPPPPLPVSPPPKALRCAASKKGAASEWWRPGAPTDSSTRLFSPPAASSAALVFSLLYRASSCTSASDIIVRSRSAFSSAVSLPVRCPTLFLPPVLAHAASLAFCSSSSPTPLSSRVDSRHSLRRSRRTAAASSPRGLAYVKPYPLAPSCALAPSRTPVPLSPPVPVPLSPPVSAPVSLFPAPLLSPPRLLLPGPRLAGVT